MFGLVAPERGLAIVRRYAGKVRSEGPMRRQAVLEIGVLVAGPWALYGLLRDDASLGPSLPVWAVSLAIPLGVGLMHGLRATLWAMAASWLLPRAFGWPLPEWWHAAALPAGALGALAGQLTDARRRALASARDHIATQGRLLEQQDRDLRVWRASHALLAERCDARQWSLSAAVEAARRTATQGPASHAGAALLGLLESQARVRAAAVYVARLDGRLPLEPTATLGALRRPSSRHLSVRTAFGRGQMMVPRCAAGAAHLDDEVVLALPLVDSRGTRLGVVAVHDLPFVAAHDAHFQFIATLVNGLADAVREGVGDRLAALAPANESSAPPRVVALPARASDGLPPVASELTAHLPKAPTAVRSSRPATRSETREASRVPTSPPPLATRATTPPSGTRALAPTRDQAPPPAPRLREPSGMRPTQAPVPHARRLDRASGA